MFERYTEQARRAIFYARYEASFNSAGAITAGHILVGIMREGERRSVAVGFLKDHEMDLRSTLGISAPSGRAPIDLMRQVPLDGDAKMALAYAAREADLDESFYIHSDHLLRGILNFPNAACTALQSISFDLARAREASKSLAKEFPRKKTIYHRLFGRPLRAHRDIYIKLLTFLVVTALALLLIRWINH